MAIINELVEDLVFNIGFRRKYARLQKEANKGAPKAGEMAPDFTLSDSRGETSITLSDFRGEKPVGLIFGSFT